MVFPEDIHASFSFKMVMLQELPCYKSSPDLDLLPALVVSILNGSVTAGGASRESNETEVPRRNAGLREWLAD